MATIKSYTDVNQSRKLAEILPFESADMAYWKKSYRPNDYAIMARNTKELQEGFEAKGMEYIPCWSLAALLNILHSKQGDIPSLSGGGYKDGNYISDWCLDYEYDNGDYQKTFADNPVDACVAMIEKLNELNLL